MHNCHLRLLVVIHFFLITLTGSKVLLAEELAKNEDLPFKDDLAVRANAGLSHTATNTSHQFKEFGLGLNIGTEVAYRYTKLEIKFVSNIQFSDIKQVEFENSEYSIRGDGSLRNSSFGPMIKYITDYSPYKNYNFFYAAGPMWSHQTLRLREVETFRGEYDSHYKFVYNSKGYAITVGFEEMLPKKTMHPLFIELTYSKQTAYKAQVADTTNIFEVETLYTENIKQKITGEILTLSLGCAIF